MSSRRQLPAQTSFRAGLHSHKNSRAVALLTFPHLPQVFLIDSRALARLRYAQMFSTEPFIIEIGWFNLYSAVLQLRQHLSPTLEEKQKSLTGFCLCLLWHVTYLYILPGMAGRTESDGEPSPQPGSAHTWKHETHARTSNVQPALMCHLKPPKRGRGAPRNESIR